MKITLSAIPAALTMPVLDGTAALEGLDINPFKAQSVDRNSRQMLDQQFDVAEMSFATFLKAKEDGLPLIGLPIFTGRRFLQPCISFSGRAGIASPSELSKRKVGLPQYWMTSSVWHRGLLLHEYGVKAEDIYWQTTTRERLATLQFPPGVNVETKESDLQGLRNMLIAGEVDAVLSPRPVNPQDIKSGVAVPSGDMIDIQRDYYQRTKILPIMHFVVMRQGLEAEYPGLAKRIYNSFAQAKDLAYSGAYTAMPLESPIHGETFEQSKDFFNGDPWPYGLEKNNYVLEVFLEYAYEQGLVKRRFKVEELFAPSTHNLA
jgi:4,5-dihydroxyphthalate decarboxylase